MDPREVAAHFAAFVWFSNRNPKTREEEAVQYANDNWHAFLPLAHEGLGRLLLKIASPRVVPVRRRRLRPSGNVRQTPKRKPMMAGVRGG